MKQNLLKVFALVCAMFVNASAWADGAPTLAMDNFTIEPGTSVDVNLKLVQDGVTVKAFQCAIELPAGLTMAKPKAVNGTMTDEDEEPTKPSVAFNEVGNTIAVYSGEGYPFNADATNVLKITFTADATFQGGNITIKDISISDANNNAIDPAAVTVVASTSSTPPTPAIEGPALILEFEGMDEKGYARVQQGGTIKANIIINQDVYTVKALQCVFDLPEWLTMAKPKAVNGTMTDEDEEPTKPSVAFNEEGNSLAVYSGEGYPFNADATKILTVEFTAIASASTEESANRYDGGVTLKEISFSDKDNNIVEVPDYYAPLFYKVGVEDLKANNASNDIYSVTGTRVNNMTRGLYIVNGKKVVVK
jgi:hypothetical protein